MSRTHQKYKRTVSALKRRSDLSKRDDKGKSAEEEDPIVNLIDTTEPECVPKAGSKRSPSSSSKSTCEHSSAKTKDTKGKGRAAPKIKDTQKLAASSGKDDEIDLEPYNQDLCELPFAAGCCGMDKADMRVVNSMDWQHVHWHPASRLSNQFVSSALSPCGG